MIQSVRKRRWRWLMGLSLALNLLVIGAVAGSAWRHMAGDGQWRANNRGVALSMPYVRALPPDAQQALRASIRDHMPRNKRRAAQQAQYKAVAAALMENTFNREQMRALLVKHRDIALLRSDVMLNALLSILDDMDVTTRQAYANRLMKQSNNHSRHQAKRE